MDEVVFCRPSLCPSVFLRLSTLAAMWPGILEARLFVVNHQTSLQNLSQAFNMLACRKPGQTQSGATFFNSHLSGFRLAWTWWRQWQRSANVQRTSQQPLQTRQPIWTNLWVGGGCSQEDFVNSWYRASYIHQETRALLRARRSTQ